MILCDSSLGLIARIDDFSIFSIFQQVIVSLGFTSVKPQSNIDAERKQIITNVEFLKISVQLLTAQSLMESSFMV